ncbi:glycosyltransferase family 9 protein [Cellulomonas sp. URHB0016]
MSAQQAGDVLVLRALGLGDALTGVPALRGVRRAWPDRRLVLAAPARLGSWLRDLGLVDAVAATAGLGTPVPWAGGGHVAVNLHGRGPQSNARLRATGPQRLVTFATPGHDDGPPWRDDEHEVDRWCRLVRWAGGPCGREDLRLEPPGDDLERAGARHEVLLHPGAASVSRRWPPGRWTAVARHLVRAGRHVTLTGDAREVELCARVGAGLPGVTSTAGRLTLPALAARVAAADLLVCGDTGVAHLATALGTPSVLLFGPVSPDRWGPAVDPERHTVLWHGDARTSGDPHGATTDPVLAATTVAEVVAAVERQLDRADLPTPG